MLHNAAIREQKNADKLAKAQYLEDRLAEADDMNSDVEERLNELQGILQHTLSIDDTIDFSSLKIKPRAPDFRIPPELAPASPPDRTIVAPPTWYQKLIPGNGPRYAAALARARSEHEAQLLAYDKREEQKRIKRDEQRSAHEKLIAARRAEAESRNADVDELEAHYRAGQTEAVVTYNEMVLARSDYPSEGFSQKFRVAYVQASRELVVEYDLPEPSIVPVQSEFKYVRNRDAIESRGRKVSEVKQIYQDVVAAIALRTIHELIEADQADVLASVAFTGIRDTHDPATGNAVRVPVISVRTTKSEFAAIRLDRVDKLICLRNLGAQVSGRPDELQAVKPIVEFDMVDRRFIEQGDALTGLESRPNLMELTPTEFEVLVSNLFTKMGLDTKLTRASRDGGVDAVAFDLRPVVGGKVVIQAKRYKDTVGVSAVRDLYGTMQHEGANKGVLVSTSGYGPDAFQFSKDKPIELIDGGGLLYLLREHAGVNARIQSN